MKKTILFCCVLLYTLTSFSQIKKAKSDPLVGYAKKSDFLSKQYKGWFEHYYKNYTPEKKVVDQIKQNLQGVSVLCFMGTWCRDSKRETPRFYKVMEAASFNFEKNFKLIALNKTKRTPDNLQRGFKILRIPTFIFYKKGKELGRYVEYPRESLEKDILKILEGKPYNHSYESSHEK